MIVFFFISTVGDTEKKLISRNFTFPFYGADLTENFIS